MRFWDRLNINDSWSAFYAALAPEVIGAVLGARIGGGAGAAIGVILGGALGAQSGSVLLDEQGCIWYWVAKQWSFYIQGTLPIVYPTYIPKYCRISNHNMWNYLGLANP